MYSIAHVRRSVLADAHYLGERLRPADIQEIEATQLYKGPTDALIQGFLESKDCWTITEPGKKFPLAMFGVMHEKPEMLYVPVWLLAREAITNYTTKFLRLSRECLNGLAKQYGAIGNYVDVRNEVHVRWLTWNGFEAYHTMMSPGGETLFKLYVKEG